MADIQTNSGGGYNRKTSKVITVHSDRTMKSYQVLDSELKHISTFNGWATLFFSAASACASIVIGIWTNLFVTDTPSAIAQKYGISIQCVFAVLTVVFLVLGILSTLSKRSELRRIKKESGDKLPGFWRGCMIQIGLAEMPE